MPTHPRILTIGGTGSGKTAQGRTLRGPKGKNFAYMFDPAGAETLEGLDHWEIDEWLPEAGDLDMGTRSVKKKGFKHFIDKPKTKPFEPTLYPRWIEDFNNRGHDGFFKQFDWVMLDSATTIGAAIFDRTQFLQEGVEAEDERSDYRLAGMSLSKAFLSLCSLPCGIYITAHHQAQQDKSLRVFNELFVPGGAKVRVPLLFSHIFVCNYLPGEKADDFGKYIIQTRPNRANRNVRTALRGLDFLHDVTIEDWEKPEEYGLGALFND